MKSTIKYPKITQDSVKTSIYTNKETSKSAFYKFLWGERYRKYYSIPVNAKVVYLDTLAGGLTPMRKGGGTQSKTLHLLANDGKRYVMRALKKNATQYIQASAFKDQYVEGYFENTASESLVKDVFTGSYPYAPFIVASLSSSLNIPYLKSQLYYIPKQDVLGKYNKEFGNELYVIEVNPRSSRTVPYISKVLLTLVTPAPDVCLWYSEISLLLHHPVSIPGSPHISSEMCSDISHIQTNQILSFQRISSLLKKWFCQHY